MTQVVLPFVSKDVNDLLLWRVPAKSAAVVGGATAAYLALEWSGVSVVSIVANSLLLVVAAAFVWNNVASFIGRPGFPVPSFLKGGVTDAQAKAFTDQAVVYVNKFLAFAYRLISGKDIVLAAQAAAVLFLIGKVSSWFTSLGLIFVGVVLAFSLPKIYELRKPEVDALAARAAQQGQAHYKKFVEPYVSKIPRASTAAGAADKKAE